MKPRATIWTQRPRTSVRAAILPLCLMLVGCHSIRFGPMLHEDDAVVVRATLGSPTSVPVEIQLVSAVEQPPPEPEPVTAPQGGGQPIDLATALRRAGADNPTIARADEAVQGRLAERLQARVLLFPTLEAGSNLRVHRGNYLSGAGVVTDVNTQSLYWGLGADAKGGGTLAVPGVRVVAHLGDAFLSPQAAQQKVVQSRFNATATRYYLLMEVGVRYLALAEAQASRLAYQQSLQEFAAIEQLTLQHAKSGQGRDADAQRARSEAMLLRAQAQNAEEAIGVAAAELARLLDWDPAQPLRSADVTPPVLELVNRDVPLLELLDVAMAQHPEIVARTADVAYHEIRLRQERVRPFLPLLAIGFSAGEFSGSGPNTTSRLASFTPRTDLDVVAVWSLQNLGVGNHAVQNVARSGLEAAWIERAALLDRIRREVVEAHTLVQTRRQDIDLARQRVVTSQRSYTLGLTLARNLKSLPFEVLSSARQLAAARQDLIRAMVGYSQAQLQLAAALGGSPMTGRE